MNYHRRGFIRLAGGGAVVATLGGCTEPEVARAAWSNPGAGERDYRKRALSYALLAPNPHNMQPWLADLSEPHAITFLVDTAQMLPVTDPFNRQIVVGCGAFLELLRMAAAEAGYAAEIAGFPDGEPAPKLDGRPVARIRFARGGKPDPLFRHVLARRTNRLPYQDRPVKAGAAAAIVRAAAVPLTRAGDTLEPARVARLRALVYEGANIEAHTPAAHRESVDRTFIGSKDVGSHRYGISLEGPAIEAAHAVGALTQEKMKRPGTFAYDQALDFLKRAADTAQGFVWITTAGNSRREQLAAGAAYVRANLAATADGVAMHPWSQVLQEYATQREAYGAVHRELAPEGGRVQMLARIGYAKPVPPAPRRGLEAVLERT